MNAQEKKKEILTQKINKIAGESPLVSAIYGRIPRSPEEILRDNGIDVIS